MYEDTESYSFNVTNAIGLLDKTYSIANFNTPNFVRRQRDVVAVYLGIQNITIPSSWYVVNETNSSIGFTLIVSAGAPTDYQITLLPVEYGSYNSISFCIVLNKYLVAFGIDTIFTFQYDINNNRIGIIWTNYAGPTGSSIQFNETDTTMQYLIGLVFATDYLITDVTAINEFSDQCNFTGVNLYLVQCDQIPTKNYSLQIGGPIIASVQNSASVWGITQWQNLDNTRYQLPSNKSIEQLTIRMYDESGTLINFRGQPWNITFKITYVKTDAKEAYDLHDYVDKLNTHPVNHAQQQKRLRSQMEAVDE